MTGNLPPRTSGDIPRFDPTPLFDAANLPDQFRTRQGLQYGVMPAVAATFIDGEFIMQHEPSSDPDFNKHFGTGDYAKGEFGQRMRILAESDDPLIRQQAHTLIRASADQFAVNVARGDFLIPPYKTVDVSATSSLLKFDGQIVQLAQPPQVVVDYGPGLQGAHHINQQLTDLANHVQPFEYHPVTKGPFINHFLKTYRHLHLQDAPQIVHDAMGQYTGYEGGITATTDQMVTIATNVADVVLASGIHTAGHQEIGTGIKNAFTLLKPDGALVIRAPKELETPTSVPAEDMIQMALNAGFDFSKAQLFDTVTGQSVRPEGFPGISAVFRK